MFHARANGEIFETKSNLRQIPPDLSKFDSWEAIAGETIIAPNRETKKAAIAALKKAQKSFQKQRKKAIAEPAKTEGVIETQETFNWKKDPDTPRLFYYAKRLAR